MIKAVLFDVDGVLIDSFKANQTYFSDLMQYAGYPAVSEAEYRPLFHLPMLEVIRTLTKGQPDSEVERIRKIAKGDAVAYQDSLVRLQPHVVETLEQLNGHYRLGLVSSRVADGVYELPQLKPLLSFFDVVITYEDTPRHKPDPQPLQLALEELEVDPVEAVYIGDAASDVKAAQAAGMKMITYPHELSEFTVDATTDSLAALPQIIATLD